MLIFTIKCDCSKRAPITQVATINWSPMVFDIKSQYYPPYNDCSVRVIDKKISATDQKLTTFVASWQVQKIFSDLLIKDTNQ